MPPLEQGATYRPGSGPQNRGCLRRLRRAGSPVSERRRRLPTNAGRHSDWLPATSAPATTAAQLLVQLAETVRRGRRRGTHRSRRRIRRPRIPRYAAPPTSSTSTRRATDDTRTAVRRTHSTPTPQHPAWCSRGPPAAGTQDAHLVDAARETRPVNRTAARAGRCVDRRLSARPHRSRPRDRPVSRRNGTSSVRKAHKKRWAHLRRSDRLYEVETPKRRKKTHGRAPHHRLVYPNRSSNDTNSFSSSSA